MMKYWESPSREGPIRTVNLFDGPARSLFYRKTWPRGKHLYIQRPVAEEHTILCSSNQ